MTTADVTVTGRTPTLAAAVVDTVANPAYKNLVVSIPSTTLVQTYDPLLVNVNLSGVGEESIPEPTLFYYSPENLNAVDYAYLTPLKGLTDAATLTEDYKKTVSKVPVDTVAATETLNKSSTKILSDNYTAQSTVMQAIVKIAQSTFSSQDANYLWPQKGIQDTVVAAQEQYEFVSSKWLLEPVNPTDTLVNQLNKTIVDSLTENYFLQDYCSENYTSKFTFITDNALLAVTKGFVENQQTADSYTFAVSLGKQNTVAATETLNKSSTKILSDNYTAQSTVMQAIVKIAQSTFSSQDANYLWPQKGIQDTVVAAQEQYEFVSSKWLLEPVNPTDTLVNQLNKTIVDSLTENYFLQDYCSENYTSKFTFITDNALLAVTKGFVENQQTADSYTFAVSLGKQNTVNTSEVFTRQADYNVGLASIVYPTDDVLGEANIDDDQVANVNKGLIEVIGTVELNTFYSYKQILEALNSLETIANGYLKQLESTTSTQDTKEALLTKPFAEITQLVDVITNQLQKSVVDSASIQEQSSYNANKLAQDAVVLQEAALKTLNTILGLESLLITESLQSTTSKPLFNSAGVQELIKIVMQNYVAGNYFLEDYVGTYYTLTN